jgi:hypothetical protein
MDERVNFSGLVKGILLPFIMLPLSWLFGACWNHSIAQYLQLRKMTWDEAMMVVALIVLAKSTAQVTKWFNRGYVAQKKN